MLSKKKRLTKKLFQDIMDNGKIIVSPLFLFRYIKEKDTRYAFVAPKSVAKQAHLRNKLRRMGYNALQKKAYIPRVFGIFFYKKQSKTPTSFDVSSNIDMIISKIKS